MSKHKFIRLLSTSLKLAIDEEAKYKLLATLVSTL